MTNLAVCLSAICLLYSLFSTRAKTINCSTRLISVDFVYDCRYSLTLQQSFFTHFLQKFEPLSWILNYNRAKDGEAYFSVTQMTYTNSELQIFQQLTQINFTLENFKEATSKINMFSCPQYLSLDTIFDDTSKDINKDTTGIRKFAIFVLAENMTEEEDDNELLHRLDFMENQDSYVKRLFIVIKDSNKKPTNLYYTNSLKNYLELVKSSIWLICGSCLLEFRMLTQYGSCYNVHQNENVLTTIEAEKDCDHKWPGSHLAYINSQNESDFLFLNRGILIIFVSFSRVLHRGYERPDYMIETITFANGLQEISLVGYIGLSAKWSNSSAHYLWNDGTPLVIDPPWGSGNAGKGCFFISLHFISPGINATRDHHEWLEMDCNIKKRTNFLLCESERFYEDKQLLNLSYFNHKAHGSHLNLNCQTYSNLLFNQIHKESPNKLMSLFKKTINFSVVLHKCNTNCKIEHESHDFVDKHSGKNYLFPDLISNRRQEGKMYPDNNISFQSNDNPHILRVKGFNFSNLTMSNNFKFDSTLILRNPISTVSKCLYEIDANRHRKEFQNNSYLLGCDTFVCPQGFVKCPNSYCIPAHLVHDNDKDCQHGDDEMTFDKTILCTRKFKFTLRNICHNQNLKREISNENSTYLNTTNAFVCQVPCDHDYTCVSNIVRTEIHNISSLYISYLETTVQLYKESDVFTFTPQMYSLFIFNKLIDVDLTGCKINDLNSVIKSLDILDIQFLDVSNNDMAESETVSVIQSMKGLKLLNMSFNVYLELDHNFTFPPKLQVLDLSYTKCGSGLIRNVFIYLTHLKTLVINHIKPIDLSLKRNLQIQILDVRGTKIVNIKHGYFSWLGIQNALYADDYRVCCELVRGPNIPEEKCHAPRDAISTCQDLIGNPLKRNILWLVGVLSLIGNTSVVIYRLIWDRGILKKAYGLYIISLGFSDLTMGFYLLIIAGADLLYRSNYVLADFNWRNSFLCKLAGIMSTFSSETSTMLICLITLDRFLVIRYPFGEHRISGTGKIASLCLTLIIGTVVSVFPVMFPAFENYSYNGMCLALPFSSGSYTGWEFSVIIFVGINFILFVLIACGQIAIFLALVSYKNTLSNIKTDHSRRAQELAVARQLFLVALSDFCCWFPIAILGIMSLRGFQFSLEVYAWSAILILPVNSAINPLIYTLPSIWKKTKYCFRLQK